MPFRETSHFHHESLMGFFLLYGKTVSYHFTDLSVTKDIDFDIDSFHPHSSCSSLLLPLVLFLHYLHCLGGLLCH